MSGELVIADIWVDRTSHPFQHDPKYFLFGIIVRDFDTDQVTMFNVRGPLALRVRLLVKIQDQKSVHETCLYFVYILLFLTFSLSHFLTVRSWYLRAKKEVLAPII